MTDQGAQCVQVQTRAHKKMGGKSSSHTFEPCSLHFQQVLVHDQLCQHVQAGEQGGVVGEEGVPSADGVVHAACSDLVVMHDG